VTRLQWNRTLMQCIRVVFPTPLRGENDALIVSHRAHIVLLRISRWARDPNCGPWIIIDLHYHLSTYLRVRYLTLESKRIIMIISRTVHTLLHAILRTLFVNFSWWIAKTERVLVDRTDLLLKTHRLGETRRGSEKLSNRQLTF